MLEHRVGHCLLHRFSESWDSWPIPVYGIDPFQKFASESASSVQLPLLGQPPGLRVRAHSDAESHFLFLLIHPAYSNFWAFAALQFWSPALSPLLTSCSAALAAAAAQCCWYAPYNCDATATAIQLPWRSCSSGRGAHVLRIGRRGDAWSRCAAATSSSAARINALPVSALSVGCEMGSVTYPAKACAHECLLFARKSM